FRSQKDEAELVQFRDDEVDLQIHALQACLFAREAGGHGVSNSFQDVRNPRRFDWLRGIAGEVIVRLERISGWSSEPPGLSRRLVAGGGDRPSRSPYVLHKPEMRAKRKRRKSTANRPNR